jgi:hypothetical protein
VPTRIGGGGVGRGHFVTSQTWGYNPTKLVDREAFFFLLNKPIITKQIQEKIPAEEGKTLFTM